MSELHIITGVKTGMAGFADFLDRLSKYDDYTVKKLGANKANKTNEWEITKTMGQRYRHWPLFGARVAAIPASGNLTLQISPTSEDYDMDAIRELHNEQGDEWEVAQPPQPSMDAKRFAEEFRAVLVQYDLLPEGKPAGDEHDGEQAQAASRPAGAGDDGGQADKPPQPSKDASNDDWFRWYHVVVDDKGYKMTLKELAKKMGLSYSYTRRLHSEYKVQYHTEKTQT